MLRTTLTLMLTLILSTVAMSAEVIENGPQPRDGMVDFDLRELWRVGGDDDEEFFGLVPRVATDADGNVLVLDSQTCQVHVYDSDGQRLRTLFRQGEGPGEVLRPVDMVVMGDGRVGLVQEVPGSVAFVSAEGVPAGKVAFAGSSDQSLSLVTGHACGDVLLVTGSHNQQGDRPDLLDRISVLERHDTDGQRVACYAESHGAYDFSNFRFRELEHLPPFWFSYAATADGTIYVPRGHTEYAIDVFDVQGTLQRTIHRDYQTRDRTDREVRRIERMVEAAFSGSPLQPVIEIERRDSALAYFHRALQFHADGSLWVLSGRGVRPDEPGVLAVFDVFDDSGVFTRQVRLHADHAAGDVGIFLSGRDRILVVKGYMDSLAAQFGNRTIVGDEEDEATVPEVICYEMTVRR